MKVGFPAPEVWGLEQLVQSVRIGEISLPKFQRAFVWHKEDVLSLLDSVYNGYPIGSVLLWRSSEHIKSERHIFDFAVKADSEDLYPTNYLLDGQQRLTALSGALFWDGEDPDSIWNVHFDLETESFIHIGGQTSPSFFPMNKVLSISKFIRACMEFESSPNAQVWTERADKLRGAIKEYRVPVVMIDGSTLNEIGQVFERINTSGRRLTSFDLLRASWKGEFDLEKAIEDIQDQTCRLGFGEVSEGTVIRTICAAAGFGINKPDIDRLRTLDVAEVSKAAQQASMGIYHALEFLRKQIFLPDLSYLPYDVQLILLGEFFRLSPQATKAQLSRLTNWFWATAVTQYFSGTNNKKNDLALDNIRSFATGAELRLPKVSGDSVQSALLSPFNLRSAKSITFALLLLAAKPEKSFDGKEIDLENLPSLVGTSFKDLMVDSEHVGLNIGQVLHPFRNQPLPGGTINEDSLSNLLLSVEMVKYWNDRRFRDFIEARTKAICSYVQKLIDEVPMSDTGTFNSLSIQ